MVEHFSLLLIDSIVVHLFICCVLDFGDDLGASDDGDVVEDVFELDEVVEVGDVALRSGCCRWTCCRLWYSSAPLAANRSIVGQFSLRSASVTWNNSPALGEASTGDGADQTCGRLEFANSMEKFASCGGGRNANEFARFVAPADCSAVSRIVLRAQAAEVLTCAARECWKWA